MAWLQAAAIGLIALIIAPGYLFYFDITPKLAVLLAGTAVVLWLVRPARTDRLFTWLLVAGAASAAFSTALSVRPTLSLFGTNWRRFGAAEQITILLLAWTVAAVPTSARTILRGVAIAGALSAAYGVAQYFGWDPLLAAATYHVGEGIWTIVRPPGTLGYVSYFATWLLFAAFLSMELAERDKAPGWAAVAALATGAMLLTGTRAAVAGLAVGLAVWVWRAGRLPGRRVWIGAAAILAAVAAFYFSPAGLQMRSRTRWFVEDPAGGARPKLFRDSLFMAMHRPVAGFGPETFTAQFPHYESEELARAYPDFAHESPHNIFLDALVSQGVPGALALVAVCAFGLWRARGSPWLCAALTAGIVSQQFTVFTIPTAVILYSTIALAAAPASSARLPVRGVIWLRVASLAMVYLAVRFTVADHYLELARKALESGDPRGGATEYARFERWRLPGTSSDLWYSRVSLALAQKAPDANARALAAAQAGGFAMIATATAEDPFDAWYQMAIVRAAQNDPSQTESSLRAAIGAHPNWFKPHWTLAQLLLLERRIPEALREAERAAELNGGKNPEVARTLAEVKSCCR